MSKTEPNFNPNNWYIVNVTFTEQLDYTGTKTTKWNEFFSQSDFLNSLNPIAAGISCISSTGTGLTTRSWMCIFDNQEIASIIKMQNSDLSVSVHEYVDYRLVEQHYLEQIRLKKEKNKLIYQKRKLRECQKKLEHFGN